MYSKIMVPLDGSQLAECVLPHVEAITIGCKIATVVFVRVIDPGTVSASLPAQGKLGSQEKNRRQLEEERKKNAEAYLKKIIDSTNIENAVLNYEVLEGRVAETLEKFHAGQFFIQPWTIGNRSLGNGQCGRPDHAFGLHPRYDDPCPRLRYREMIGYS